MARIDLNTLKTVPLFSDLDERELLDVAGCISRRNASKGENICRIGEENEWLYIVSSGYLRVSLPTPEGTSKFLSTFAVGACFGEMSLVTDERISANVTAVIDSEIYLIHKKDFLNILHAHPSVSVKLNKILSERLKETNVRSSSSIKKARETVFSAIIGAGDHIDDTVDLAFLVSSVLANSHDSRVLLLICVPKYELAGRGKVEKRLAEQKDEGGIFNIYTGSENMKVGILKTEQWNGFREHDRELIDDFVRQYNHIIAVSHEREGLMECLFFSQAHKTVYVFFERVKADHVKERLKSIPGQSETGIAFVSSKLHDSLRSKTDLRSFFRGPVFHYSSESVSSAGGVARVARFLDNVSLGMVFGGGGARGFAHIGVMKVLERNGIEPDIYCGSSMGAIVASMFAMGYDAAEVERTMNRQWAGDESVLDFQFPYQCIVKGKKLNKLAEITYGEMTFDDLIYDLYILCADLISGEEVVLDSGLLTTAIFASGAIPGIFRPVSLGDKYLVDGGILNKMPASVLRTKGVDNIIAVNVTPKRDMSLARQTDHGSDSLFKKAMYKHSGVRDFFSGPNILQIITRSFNMVGMHLSSLQLDEGDFMIQPNLDQYDFYEFKKFDEIMAKGEEAAEASISEIKKAFNIK